MQNMKAHATRIRKWKEDSFSLTCLSYLRGGESIRKSERKPKWQETDETDETDETAKATATATAAMENRSSRLSSFFGADEQFKNARISVGIYPSVVFSYRIFSIFTSYALSYFFLIPLNPNYNQTLTLTVTKP
jgi:hypothetical protein